MARGSRLRAGRQQPSGGGSHMVKLQGSVGQSIHGKNYNVQLYTNITRKKSMMQLSLVLLYYHNNIVLISSITYPINLLSNTCQIVMSAFFAALRRIFLSQEIL